MSLCVAMSFVGVVVGDVGVVIGVTLQYRYRYG